MTLPDDPDGYGIYTVTFQLPDGTRRTATIQGRGRALDADEALWLIDVVVGWLWPHPVTNYFADDDEPARGTLMVCGDDDTHYTPLTRVSVRIDRY